MTQIIRAAVNGNKSKLFQLFVILYCIHNYYSAQSLYYIENEYKLYKCKVEFYIGIIIFKNLNYDSDLTI